MILIKIYEISNDNNIHEWNIFIYLREWSKNGTLTGTYVVQKS